MQTQNQIVFPDLDDSCEVCSSGSESDESVFDLCEGLAKWAIQFQLSFVALNALLLLLIKCNTKVSKDARTLLKTPASVIERKVGDGTYVHYGLKNGLTDFLVKNNWKLSNITLDFGIDGLPLFKSSSKQVWPVLSSVVGASYVFLIGVYEGTSKPSCANDFLEKFISSKSLKDIEIWKAPKLRQFLALYGAFYNEKSFKLRKICSFLKVILGY